MLRNFVDDFRRRKKARREGYGRDITDPNERRRSRRYLNYADHGILRRFWTNFGEVAPGVFRSNHPPHGRLAAYKSKGIKAILNLRGTAQRAPYLFEVESCAALGLTLVSVSLTARKAAPREDLLALFDHFDTIPRPFLMHCKSGADRAGLASALYVLDNGGSVADARRQLSLRYLHLRFTRTGIQDHMLDLFQDRQSTGPISIRDWIRTEYDPEVLSASFARKRFLPV